MAGFSVSNNEHLIRSNLWSNHLKEVLEDDLFAMKYVDMIGWDDVPHLRPPHIEQKELDDLEASILPHQRQARRTGRPSLGAGAIYPVDEGDLLIDPFKLPDHWPRAYALDPGWRKTACLWGAWDEDADVYVKCDLCGGAPKCVEVCPTDALTYVEVEGEVSDE